MIDDIMLLNSLYIVLSRLPIRNILSGVFLAWKIFISIVIGPDFL